MEFLALADLSRFDPPQHQQMFFLISSLRLLEAFSGYSAVSLLSSTKGRAIAKPQ
jgi:hypothetical protein